MFPIIGVVSHSGTNKIRHDHCQEKIVEQPVGAPQVRVRLDRGGLKCAATRFLRRDHPDPGLESQAITRALRLRPFDS